MTKLRQISAAVMGVFVVAAAELSLPGTAAAQSSSSWLGGWLSLKPSAQDMQFMFQGKDPALLKQLNDATVAVQKNPNDEAALSMIGAICLNFSRVKGAANMWGAWQDIAAKTLERAIQLDPKDWIPW